MKSLRSTLILYQSNIFKNTSIVLGVFLSVFLVSSFRSDDGLKAVSGTQGDLKVEQLEGEALNIDSDEILLTKKSTKYHNFLASYFLQESSVKRTNKKEEEAQSRNILSNLKDFHNIITSKRSSLF